MKFYVTFQPGFSKRVNDTLYDQHCIGVYESNNGFLEAKKELLKIFEVDHFNVDVVAKNPEDYVYGEIEIIPEAYSVLYMIVGSQTDALSYARKNTLLKLDKVRYLTICGFDDLVYLMKEVDFRLINASPMPLFKIANVSGYMNKYLDVTKEVEQYLVSKQLKYTYVA